MPDKTIYRTSELMKEQASAYVRLTALFESLATALAYGQLGQIDSLTRTAEGELIRLRSRLAQITSLLSSFASERGTGSERSPVSAEARAAFEAASDELLSNARNFQRTRARAAALAINGAAFAGACIGMYGIPPTTYGGPYNRRGDGPRWQ